MKKVTPIGQRKTDHIRINLEENVRSALSTGLEKYQFIHEALPELDLDEIDTSLTLFGKKLNAPILISSMTGGTETAARINHNLAEAAKSAGVAMALGSQRVALEKPATKSTFTIARKVAPELLLFANLGAVQLNYGVTLDHCRQVVEMIYADALILHLNPLQEAVQEGGDTYFSSLAGKIEDICTHLAVPVIAKEVGWGISKRTARLLANCGVSAIDVAGAGGTSWSQVEMHRASNEFTRRLAASFLTWGIPTAESILNVKQAAPSMVIFASGGLIDGLDIGKSIALGATLGGMAGNFLKAANESQQAVLDLLSITKKQLSVAMFASGIRDLHCLTPKCLKKRD